jgi:hypothetical protein
MKDETAEALTKSRQILTTAAQEGAHVLFAPPTLEILGRLSPASDDYDDDDAWGKIRDLKDEIAEFFKAREENLMCDWETILHSLHALSQDVYRRRQRSATVV